jgi:hypothetical protein
MVVLKKKSLVCILDGVFNTLILIIEATKIEVIIIWEIGKFSLILDEVQNTLIIGRTKIEVVNNQDQKGGLH